MTPSPVMPRQAADAADARKAVALLVALLVPALTCACAASFPMSSSSPGEGAALTGAGRQASEMGRLAGLDASEVITLVGEPDFRRNDPPAQLWQYRSAACVLDVYLYREGDAYRVTRVESRERSLAGALASTGPDPDHCAGTNAPLRSHLRQSRL